MLAIAGVLFLACLAAAIYFSIALVRTTTASGLASLPVDRASEITLPSGEVVLEDRLGFH